MAQATATKPATAYEALGGGEVIRKVVDRFYDLMDQDPAYAELRALHAPDLTPMRESLTGYLIAWVGGPRDWFEANPGRCMMSAHRGVAMTEASARQWADAMRRAVDDSVDNSALGAKMGEALGDLALSMGGVGR